MGLFSKGNIDELCSAAYRGDYDEVVRWVQKGTDVNRVNQSNSMTPLQMAAWKNHGAIVAYLLDNGSDIDKASADGWSALHWAASEGHAGIVHMLLSAGARMDGKTDFGTTPFALALNKGHLDAANVLKESGAR